MARIPKTPTERRYNAIADSLSSALDQDGFDMNRYIIQRAHEMLMLIPETYDDPVSTFRHLARVLDKAARYAESNIRDTPI